MVLPVNSSGGSSDCQHCDAKPRPRGRKKPVFTKAMSAHEVSPALSLRAVFQKLFSCAGENDIRGIQGSCCTVSSLCHMCCWGAHDTVVRSGMQLVLSWQKLASLYHSVFSEERTLYACIPTCVCVPGCACLWLRLVVVQWCHTVGWHWQQTGTRWHSLLPRGS